MSRDSRGAVIVSPSVAGIFEGRCGEIGEGARFIKLLVAALWACVYPNGREISRGRADLLCFAAQNWAELSFGSNGPLCPTAFPVFSPGGT
jgi:hypothetical protein